MSSPLPLLQYCDDTVVRLDSLNRDFHLHRSSAARKDSSMTSHASCNCPQWSQAIFILDVLYLYAHQLYHGEKRMTVVEDPSGRCDRNTEMSYSHFLNYIILNMQCGFNVCISSVMVTSDFRPYLAFTVTIYNYNELSQITVIANWF